MPKKIDSITFKKRNIGIWNEIASRYHKRWAGTKKGPFQSSKELLKIVKIKKGSKILDLGCGTGIVINDLLPKVGTSGIVVGLDSSLEAIKIANKLNRKKNVGFVISDAETVYFEEKFDLITCQYALFFFPNALKVLRNIREFMQDGATLAVTVHGEKRNVPYFGIISDAISQFIPDYIPLGTPNLDRFGTKKALVHVADKAGFNKIKVKEYNFEFSPGTLEDYWGNYLRYVAKPLREKLFTLSAKQRREIKNSIGESVVPFTKKEKITFPWQVLTLTAKNN